MLSKSLIQFSFDEWGCVPSLLFDLRPIYEVMKEVMNIMVTSFQRSQAGTAAHNAPSPAASHHRPMPPPETPELSQASLSQSLVGSLPLSPESWCTQGFVYGLQESVSQSFVSSGGSIVGLMETSPKRAYATPRSTAPRAPAPAAVHC